MAVFVVLALAPAARADVRIGSDLSATPGPAIGCSGGCTFGSEATAAAGGVITRWRIKAGAEVTEVHLVVVRRPSGPTGPGEVVQRTAPVTPPANAISVYQTQRPIAAGESIGIQCCVAPGAAYFGATGATARWDPPLADGESLPPTSMEPVELLVNADVEPDLDGDGNGDDTQDDDDDADGVPDGTDACPTRSGTGADGCPVVVVPPPPAAPRVNQPPTVRFRTPLAGSAIGPSQAVELEVSDDSGAPTVSVFDDDGTICTVSAPPYSCTWTPTGADVGRATLLASAVDADGRSTLGIVRVKVSRFEADLTARRKGRRVSGRLRLPRAVERSLGCRGEVTVRRRKVRRTVKLKRNCTYTVRLPRGRGKPRARFAGNAVVEPAT